MLDHAGAAATKCFFCWKQGGYNSREASCYRIRRYLINIAATCRDIGSKLTEATTLYSGLFSRHKVCKFEQSTKI